MRVLILGNKGMLGRDMEKVFHGHDIIGMDKDGLDIMDREKVFETMITIQPELVINCAAYTNVDQAEKEQELADEINGFSVGVIAQACREIDATLVHFSTDYVFDGELKNGYNEEAAPNPVNQYGRSKMLGENLLMEEMELLDETTPIEGKYFLIRTSWLFGKHGKNFVETMLKLASEQKQLKVVNDQHGKPTFTEDLCNQVKWLVESREYPSGIYHITNEGATTWYDFAREIFLLTNTDIDMVACSSEEYERPAKRPMNSVLLNTKLPELRDWKLALADYLNTKNL